MAKQLDVPVPQEADKFAKPSAHWRAGSRICFVRSFNLFFPRIRTPWAMNPLPWRPLVRHSNCLFRLLGAQRSHLSRFWGLLFSIVFSHRILIDFGCQNGAEMGAQVCKKTLKDVPRKSIRKSAEKCTEMLPKCTHHGTQN